MSFLKFEGTKDFIVCTPALIVTFRASGSIQAGTFVTFDAGGTGDVYTSTGTSGSYRPIGLALSTKTSGTEVPVLVWGYAKNIPITGSAVKPGDILVGAQSGFGSTSGSNASGSIYAVGTIVTSAANGGSCLAFIDCIN